MNPQDVLALYDEHERRVVAWPGFRREETPALVRHVALTPGRTGFVIYSRLQGEDVDATIQGEIATFRGLGQGFGWKVYAHDWPADLADRLASHGLERQEDEAIMALDLADAPPALLEPVTHDVRLLSDPAELAVVAAIHQAVWDDDAQPLIAELAEIMVSDPELSRVYVAYVDGVPASTGRLTYMPGTPFAGLWGGSTLPAYRKRGLYTALLAIRVQQARRSGARYLTIDASPMSRPIVERFGFQLLTRAMDCDWHLPATG